MASVLVIAEAGVNHNGSVETALEMIDAAAEAGADAVKFQTFTHAGLATADAPMAQYQQDSETGDKTQTEMLARLELDSAAHQVLMQRCAERDVMFLSSPFDLESIDLLAGLGSSTFKVPSGEVTDLPYLRRLGALKARVIMSTGMATLDEVGAALQALLEAGTAREDVTLMQCTTAYPAPAEQANLAAMVTMREAFGVPVGYSDHTLGPETALAAVALGATAVEKHFTLDKNASGPDHRASAEPDELASLIRAIRKVERALGDGAKAPSPAERSNVDIVRKSIVAARDIAEGETFDRENLTTKRPGTGLSPMRWDEVVGHKASRSFRQDEAITL